LPRSETIKISEMKIITSISAMQKFSAVLKKRGKTIGFVPTMGALHSGHMQLVKKCTLENDFCVVSVFVNPTQFGPKEDFNRYPRTFLEDKKLCDSYSVDAIFFPNAAQMYPGNHKTSITVNELSDVLCGKFRIGHFSGVATVVAKLFNIVMPTNAYFGMKDYQQLKIIEHMCTDLNFPVRIIPCKTVRESSGLAISSRNKYLSNLEKENSSKIYAALIQAKKMILKGNNSCSKIKNTIINTLKTIPISKLDYVSICDSETLIEKKSAKAPALIAVAAYVGKTRLIDNILIEKP